MKIAVFGTGYVGLVTATCLAENGHVVTGIDVDKARVRHLVAGKVPLHEPGLEDLFRPLMQRRRLLFAADAGSGMRGAEIAFICVGTPPLDDGSTDLSMVQAASAAAVRHATGALVLVVKSTVPVGSTDRVEALVRPLARHRLHVAFNPEFLKEGSAVEDFLRPDRVVIGTRDPAARVVMETLYAPFVRNGRPVIVMDPRSAELTKYAANALLACRISFMNEIANLAEATGADVGQVRVGIGTDQRIGMAFLYAGPGFGGSCFPKDLKSLVAQGRVAGVNFKSAQAALDINEQQKLVVVKKLERRLGSLKGKTVAIWGLAFKAGTDDLREAPSLAVVAALLAKGARITAYDPAAAATARVAFGKKIKLAADPLAALTGADALVLLTEWREFRSPDFRALARRLKAKLIVDGRNLYRPEDVSAAGLTYESIGRPAVTPEGKGKGEKGIGHRA